MIINIQKLILLFCGILTFHFSSGALFADESAKEVAAIVQTEAKVEKGLCLVIDIKDGKLVAEIAKVSQMYVQGCSWDSKNIQLSRQNLKKENTLERSSIIFIESDFLPYADNLINVVVYSSYGDKKISIEEIIRVMTPNAVCVLGNDYKPEAIVGVEKQLKEAGVKSIKSLSRKGWLSFAKPENLDFDTWPHNSGGADLSLVNNDKVVGPWEELRWIGEPRWGALAGTYSGRVTCGGRIYYVENRSDNHWWVSRDAYNGTELWRVPIEGKGWVPLWGPGNSLACDENWTFASHKNVLTARDGKTGKIVKEYSPGIEARNVSSFERFLLVSDVAKNIVKNGTAVAMSKDSGTILWKRTTVAQPPIVDGVAFVITDKELEAVEMSSGKSIWKTIIPVSEGDKKIFCKENVIYVQYLPPWKPVTLLAVFDAKAGGLLWSMENPAGNFARVPFKDGLCLLDSGKDKVSMVVDPLTGKKIKEFILKGINGKCYAPTSSANYILFSSSSFFNVKASEEKTLTTVRSPCFLGHLPANGLTYFLPHHCDCSVTLRGFVAMSGAGQRKWLAEKDGATKLFSSESPSTQIPENSEDWSMYRKDTIRSNFTTTKVSVKPKVIWSEKIGINRLTQVVSAYGMVYVANPETGRVFGLDAKTGKEKWSFIAEGRVDFSPALHLGMCYFSTNNGFVYCLDALTGKTIWQLRAAPAEKYIAEEGKFASSWPVIGGVLPMKGKIYFNCGRSQGVDGGMWIFSVEATTGKINWRVRGGSSGDVCLSDGVDLYLTKNSFNINNGALLFGGKAYSSKGLLRTTAYLTPVSVTDYMACVEPALSSEKHIELTDGITTGENISFNEKIGVAAWRYRFGVGADLMKKDKPNQRFLYAKEIGGAIKWRMDEGVNLQMMGLVMTNDNVFMAGVPTSKNQTDKSELWVISVADGKKLFSLSLDNKPTYDGLSAANGKLYLSTEDGNLICYGE